MYVTVNRFEDVSGILWPAPSLLVAEGLVSNALGQEEIVKWFTYIVASALHMAFEKDLLYPWT